MSDFSSEILRIVVGHCSHNVGWNGIQASSLDLLTEVLQKYIVEIGQLTNRYSEQFGRGEPNLDDLGLTFREMGISIHDLADFVANVEPTPLPQDIAKYPIPREHHLNFLKPGSQEVLSRPVHIDEHFPPMHQIVQEEEPAIEGSMEPIDEGITPTPENVEALMEISPSKANIFKRPDLADKRRGLWLEEGQPLREITSIMMTTSGFLSSSREGKLPEARLYHPPVDCEPESSVDKKVNMKKIIEGIKKSDENTKKKDKVAVEEPIFEKEPENVADVVEKEKEKTKKKRNKEKVMEEFDFFAKEKTLSIKPIVPETKALDPTNQKLSIFRKISKIRDPESSSSSQAARASSESLEIPGSSFSSADEVGTPKSSKIAETPSSSSFEMNFNKPESSKKERKQKRDRTELKESVEFIKETKVNSKKLVKSTGKDQFFPPKEETIVDQLNQSKEEKSNTVGLNMVEPSPKRKRGRPPRVAAMTPEPTMDLSRMAGTPSPTPSGLFVPPPNKPFFPYPTHFPTPGGFPPPFFQNLPVPLNLLGINPLNIPHPNQSPVTPRAPSPSPLFFSPPPPAKSESRNMFIPSPTKSPLNIVDSLPESAEMSGDANLREESTKKKDKRDKKEKEKKKKDKKLRDKFKEDDVTGKKNKKEKKKEKKEKEKSKEREEILPSPVPSVPKITFKFGAHASPSPTPESTPKLIIKPMAEKEPTISPSPVGREVALQSPVQPPPVADVAKFSALITRPPKAVKPTIKKEILFDKPLFSDASPIPSTSASMAGEIPRTPSPSPKVRREKPQKPPKVTKEKEKEKEKKKSDSKPGDVAVITETVGSYYDEFGNKIWICPACGRQDDGTPMIGCDECDDWYHWICVGIRVPPAETESWFCQRCIAKKQGSLKDKKKGRKKV